MALFSDEVSIIKIGAPHQRRRPVDPNVLTTDEIQAAEETMKKVEPNLRNFWASQTDTVNDFVNGNIDMTYTWPDGYWKIKNHPKMKGVPIELHAAEGGPPGLGLRLRPRRQHQGARARHLGRRRGQRPRRPPPG